MKIDVQDAISDQEFNDLMEQEVDYMLGDKEPKTGIVPRLLITMREAPGRDFVQGLAMFADLPDVNERRKAMRGLGHKLAEDLFYKEKPAKNPVCIMFTSEAWRLNHEMDKDKDRVSDHDDKIESVAIFGLTIDGRTNMAMFDVTRDKKQVMSLKLQMFKPYKPNSKMQDQSFLLQEFFIGVRNYVINKKGAKSE